jgi:hypothetical protein
MRFCIYPVSPTRRVPCVSGDGPIHPPVVLLGPNGNQSLGTLHTESAGVWSKSSNTGRGWSSMFPPNQFGLRELQVLDALYSWKADPIEFEFPGR